MRETMNDCYDDGVLRAFLDDAVDRSTRAAVAEHVASCATCDARLDELRRRSAQIARLLASPTPAPEPAIALAKLRGAISETRRVQPITLPWSQTMQTTTRTGSNRRRNVLGSVAVAAVALSLLLFPPVRAAADQLLQSFRVQSVMFVPTDMERIQQLEELDFDENTLFVAEPTLVNQPAPDREVASLDEATPLVGFTPGQPTDLASPPETSEILVRDRHVVQFEVNVEATRQLLALMNVDDVTIPDALGDQPIVGDLPPSLQSRYRGADYSIDLYQGISPTVNLPEGVDLSQLGRAALRMLGMDPRQAEAVSQAVDWNSTFVFPFPADIANVQQVTIGGTPGLMVGDDNSWQVYWQRGERFYILQTTGLEDFEVLAAAESVR